MLVEHDGARIHRDDAAIDGFVTAGSGADVENALGVAECRENLRRDPWVGTSMAGVVGTDRVVTGEDASTVVHEEG